MNGNRTDVLRRANGTERNGNGNVYLAATVYPKQTVMMLAKSVLETVLSTSSLVH